LFSETGISIAYKNRYFNTQIHFIVIQPQFLLPRHKLIVHIFEPDYFCFEFRTYNGIIENQKQENQQKMKKTLFIFILLLTAIGGQAQSICGSWGGVLKLHDKEIFIVFKVAQNGENYTSTMLTPTQKSIGYTTSSTEFENNILTIKMDNADMNYQARLIDGEIFKGIFTQMGKSYALNLKNNNISPVKVAENAKLKRHYSYSYYSDSVKVNNNLNAIVTLPIKKSKSAAIILDCELGYNNTSCALNNRQNIQELIDVLSSNGFIVFYSTNGNCDKEAATAYLKSVQGVNEKKISILKVSENELMATINGDTKRIVSEKKINNKSDSKINTFNRMTSWLLRMA